MTGWPGPYRDAATAKRLAAAIHAQARRPWRIMEVCGGQTHSLIRHGLDQMLPGTLTLIHGPGCPVCVTPVAAIDQALAIAARPGVVLCSFGDMLRVPGSRADLLGMRAQGADVRVLYSPLDAVRLASEQPGRQVVFFAVGFETTAPATALAAYQATRARLRNFSLLVCHVRVPPVIEALLGDPGAAVQGLLGAGHVSSVMGDHEYRPLARRYRTPIVITGFEPVDILQGVLMCVRQLEQGRHEVENQYRRLVRPEGNQVAQALMRQVFCHTDRHWRGLGLIKDGGLALTPGYAHLDAGRRFEVAAVDGVESGECRSGEVLRGRIKPPECPKFGRRCTPASPLGATMVSSEGACAAYFRYRGGAAAQDGAAATGH